MSDLYKIRNGKRIKLTVAEKTQRLAEIEADKPTAEDIKKEADKLYKELRKTFYIVDGETYEFDIETLLLFDSQIKNKASDIKVKEKGKKIKKTSKLKSVDIMNKINAYLESISDAYNDDYDLIDALDFTMPNLTSIKAAQEDLKGE